jgi:2'-5' RNA ligase
MYWVIALFDTKTEQVIKSIWEELSANSISFYSDEVKDGRPHLTLGNYYELNKGEYIGLMDTFYEKKGCFDITFNTIGSFLNYQTLFLSPTITKELIDFHTNHHNFFEKFNRKANSYYLPNQWIPHCTLANKLPHDQLSEAYAYCLKNFQTIKGKIKEVALIEMVGEYRESFEAPIIYSKTLK